MTWSDRLLKWIEPEDNPRNTIYGALAAGFVIAAENPAVETYPRVSVAAVVAIASYWLAHGYAHAVGERLRRDTEQAASIRHLVDALVHEWPLAEGAAIPLVTLLVAWAAGAPLTAGVTAAVWSTASALVIFEVASGLRRRVKPSQLITNAAVGFALGGALLEVKLLLH